MRFKKLNSEKLFNVNISKYLIDWNAAPSKCQKVLQDFLYPYWKNHVVCAEFPVLGSKLRIDLLNLTRRVAIEMDGKQHIEFNAFFHNNSRMKYLDQIKRDYKKDMWLEHNDIRLIRVIETETKNFNKAWFLEKFDLEL